MNDKSTKVDYLIIGAGPAGLQLGYFMQKAGMDYLILEAGPGAGTFYETYPRHRKLISINKVHTGYDDPEKNLRWDWNSLIADTDELLFKNYSKRYFPDADVMVRYLQDFAAHYALNIHYDTRVSAVSRDGDFRVTAENGAVYQAKRLIVATGVSKAYTPNIPGIELAEPYATFSTDPEDFAGQSVLIIGKGNSGFETADNLVETTSFVHIASPRPLKLAWETKFVGHLRAVNNNFLDTYQLKSQNAVLDGTIEKIERDAEGKYLVTISYTHANGEREQLVYDRVLACTGFRFDPDPYAPECRPELTINDRFPKMTGGWESANVPDMFFAGTLTQERDFKKSSSGFIHGFRFNVRTLCHLLADRYEGRPLPRRFVDSTVDAIAEAILERANRTSALWQLFGHLCDVVQIDTGAEKAHYFEELPLQHLPASELGTSSHYFTLTLEFGELNSNPFAIERNPDPEKAQDSKFLHPVIREFRDGIQTGELHLLEDLHAEWTKPCHVDPLKAFLADRLASVAAGTRQVAGVAAQ